MSRVSSVISVFSYSKVNFALDILGKDTSGYHEIRTVFHQLGSPRDEIIIEAIDGDEVIVECDNPRVPCDATNTVYKAAVLLKQYTHVSGGVKIFIKKKIPLMSGLGGGAGNAVAVLKALAGLWDISCCDGRHREGCLLYSLADQIGIDCRFFFYGGTAFGEHFGEKITPLPPLPPDIQFEIIETGVEISSSWAYDNINLQQCGKNIGKTEKFIEALKAGNSKGVFENLHNDFEEFIFEKHPELAAIKQKIEAKKSGRILLCGSGGCLVRIYS